MSEKHELAYMDYINGMKYKDIAKKYNVSVNTVGSWKTRYKWQKNACTDEEKECAQNKKIAHTKSSQSWVEIEHEYVSDISQRPCTLEDLATKYNLSISRITKYSMANDWSNKRKKYEKNMKQTVAEKTVELTSMDIIEMNRRHLNLTNKILDAVTEALSDDTELFKYTEVLRTGYGPGEFSEKLTTETLTAINSKKLVDLTKALKESLEIQRKALGALTPIEKHKIEIDNKKLELETLKATGDAENSGADEWVEVAACVMDDG